jgi:hypothetical protein
MLLAVLGFIAEHGRNTPFLDDFDMVPQLTGARPVTAGWLWSQHNEHRIPLPRLVFLASCRWSGCDFRAGMYFSAVALSAAAFAMILAARRIRGRTAYTDAVFPIGMLHWGHWENLLWSFQVGFVLPAVLALALLVIIARWKGAPTGGVVAVAGFALISLPLCGAPGLALTPALALWLLCAGAAAWSMGARNARRKSLFLMGAGLLALLIAAAYFIDYRHVSHAGDSRMPNPGTLARLTTSAQFAASSFGPAAQVLWPYSAVAILCLASGSAVAVIARWWKRPEDRLRCLGFLLFLSGMVCLAVGLGWGRAAWGEHAGFVNRYVTLATPALFCVYFIWQTNDQPGSRFVQMFLFALVCGVFTLNTQNGLARGREHHAKLAAFERDLRAGTPCSVLASEYSVSPRLINPIPEWFADSLRMLREANIGYFRDLQDDPPDSAGPTARFSSRRYAGLHEGVDGVIVGWAWDSFHPNTPVQVDISADGTLLDKVTADVFRPDLLQGGIGDGKHGFRLQVPARLKDGRPHSIRVRISGTNFDLKLTPRGLSPIETGRTAGRSQEGSQSVHPP